MNVKRGFSLEKKETKLLTPDDEEIKYRIENRPRPILTMKQHKKRLGRLIQKHICKHESVLFFKEDCTIRCKKCNKKLFKLASEIEFRLFCELTGIDPKNIIL